MHRQEKRWNKHIYRCDDSAVFLILNSIKNCSFRHSKFVVKELKDNADFFYTDYDMTADEWLERDIVPTNFEDLRIQSMDLMRRLNDWLK